MKHVFEFFSVSSKGTYDLLPLQRRISYLKRIINDKKCSMQSMKAFTCQHLTYMIKVLSICYSTAYMRRLANSSALQFWKWQVTGMS